jgi:hypothetical protein
VKDVEGLLVTSLSREKYTKTKCMIAKLTDRNVSLQSRYHVFKEINPHIVKFQINNSNSNHFLEGMEEDAIELNAK